MHCFDVLLSNFFLRRFFLLNARTKRVYRSFFERFFTRARFAFVCAVSVLSGLTATAQELRLDMAQTNGSVLAVAESDGVFYVGGTFTAVINPDGSTVARNRIAAIDANTGYATAWNPGADGDVVCIVPSADVVYIGGAFLNAGGQPRSRAAALNKSSGAATAWNPQPNGTVFDMLLSGNTMYMAGAFFQINGVNRFFLGAVQATGVGALLPWDPSADNFVFSLARQGNIIYAGGTFLNVGGMGRPRIAAIDATTGVPTAWNPASNNIVLSVAADAANVYAGGFFATIGGGARQGLAALDPSTGLLTAWNPACDNGILDALLLADGRIAAGGNYASIGGAARQNLATVSPVSGLLQGWANPNTNGQIELNGLASVAGESTVLVGGQFTSFAGLPRGYFAVLDQPVPRAWFSGVAFPELPANTGAVGETHTIALDRTTWAPPPGTILSTGAHYTVSGVPQGLSLVARVLNVRSVQLFFVGAAHAHAAANSVSNVQIQFTNAALANNNAGAVIGLNTQPLSITFFDSIPPPPVFTPPPPAAPIVESFSPPAGRFGDRVEIRGRNLSGVLSVSFGGEPAQNFTIISDSLIAATLGFGATGFIGVSTPAVTAFSPTVFSYRIPSATAIFSAQPTSGSVGTRVVLHGQGLSAVREVLFGGVPAEFFTVDSDEQITAVVGAGASGAISARTADGTIFAQGAQFVFFPPPTPQFFAVLPNPVQTGDGNYTITISGRNLPLFGQYTVAPLQGREQPTPVQVLNVGTTAATLLVPIDLRRAGEYRLGLSVGNIVASTTYTVVLADAPRITTQTVFATTASGEAFAVEFRGTGFFAHPFAHITLNGGIAVVHRQDSVSFRVEIPRALNITSNEALVRITNFDGQSTEAVVRIYSRNAPLITSLTPEWYGGGAPILHFVARGAGFLPPVKLWLNGRAIPVLESSVASVRALIPNDFPRPNLDDPPSVLLLENSDTQKYGYRVPSKFFYPIAPTVREHNPLRIIRRADGAMLLALPVRGSDFQPGINAQIDGVALDILSVHSDSCLLGIPQTLALPLRPDAPRTLTLINPGARSSTATVFLRFHSADGGGGEASSAREHALVFPNPADDYCFVRLFDASESALNLDSLEETLMLYNFRGECALLRIISPRESVAEIAGARAVKISLVGLPQGVYTVELRSGRSTRTARLWKR
jgi:hypothetical protein